MDGFGNCLRHRQPVFYLLHRQSMEGHPGKTACRLSHGKRGLHNDMSKERTVIRGIVLRAVDTKESDKILTVLTDTWENSRGGQGRPQPPQPHLRSRPTAGLQ